MALLIGKVLVHKDDPKLKAVVLGYTPLGTMIWAKTGFQWNFETITDTEVWRDRTTVIIDVVGSTCGDIICKIESLDIRVAEDKRLTTCEKCKNLIKCTLGTTEIFSCKETGCIVPQTTASGEIPIFHRVPMECPRPDSEVIRKPYEG